MKGQFKKGITQKYRGINYFVRIIKLGSVKTIIRMLVTKGD